MKIALSLYIGGKLVFVALNIVTMLLSYHFLGLNGLFAWIFVKITVDFIFDTKIGWEDLKRKALLRVLKKD